MQDDFGDNWDVVLLSNILHHFQPEQITGILTRARTAMSPDGTIAIWELERPKRSAPPSQGDGVALFFRLTSTAGAYSGSEYTGWLESAGFERIKIVRPRLSPGAILIHARRRAENRFARFAGSRGFATLQVRRLRRLQGLGERSNLSG